jgi:hypothetical protein
LRVVVVLLALLMSGVAYAKPIGVLVTGETLKSITQSEAEQWLRTRGASVNTIPLPADAVNTLLNCFVLDDPKCMRSVIEARSTTDALISIRIEVTNKKRREVRLTIDWFVKGSNPASARRNCDKCSETELRSTLDAMLESLSKTVPGFMGRLKVTSKPRGVTVLLDGKTIGITPIEIEVPVGDHKVQLAKDGRTGEIEPVSVNSESVTQVDLDVPTAPLPSRPEPPPPQRSSRLVPGLLIGLGVAAVGSGTALYLTSEEPSGQTPTYRDTQNLGIGVAAGGGALVLTGVIIVLATGSPSAPTMALTIGGATVGWAGTF